MIYSKNVQHLIQVYNKSDNKYLCIYNNNTILKQKKVEKKNSKRMIKNKI